MGDAVALLCVLTPLIAAGVTLLWLLYGFHELRLLFMRWIDKRGNS